MSISAKLLISAAIAGAALLSSGCKDEYQSTGSTYSGDKEFKRICIDGVEYIKGGRNMAPHFKTDGSLYLCNSGNHRTQF